MPHHGVRPQQRHAVDHVLAAAHERRVAVLPGVAAIKKHDAVAALGADRGDDCSDTVEAAHAAILPRECCEIVRRERVGERRPARDAVVIEERRASEVRNAPPPLPDPDIDRRLSEIDRHELRMEVSDVHERHVADGLEGKQVRLAQPLLREGARPTAGTIAAVAAAISRNSRRVVMRHAAA